MRRCLFALAWALSTAAAAQSDEPADAAASATPEAPPAAPAQVAPAAARGPEAAGEVVPAAAKRRRAKPPPPKAADPAPETPPEAAKAAPEPAAPATRDAVESAARAFFLALLSGDAQAIAGISALPFALEDQRITDDGALVEEWLRHLRSRRVDLLVLYGIDVLTPDEMEQKYGKPPARLGSIPWRAKDTYIAVGNLSGRGAVAVFREGRRGELQLVAYHD